MTDDERKLLLELTGTVRIILERLSYRTTLRDFDELVMPVYARVFDAAKTAPVQL